MLDVAQPLRHGIADSRARPDHPGQLVAARLSEHVVEHAFAWRLVT